MNFNFHIEYVINALENNKLIKSRLMVNVDCCNIHLLKSDSDKIQLNKEQHDYIFSDLQDDI